MRASDCVFMPKGLEVDGFIKAAEGLHGELQFRYRPANAVDRAKLTRKMSALQDEEAKEKAAGDFVASRLTEWSVVDEEGSLAPFTGEVITYHLHPAVNLKLYQIVLGNWPSDPIPDPLIPGTEDGVDPEELGKS